MADRDAKTQSNAPTHTKGRFISEAARAASLAARRAKAALPKEGDLRVFAVRIVDAGTFTWEIRRFGAIVVERGSDAFVTQAGAVDAGRRVLAVHEPDDR